MMFPTANSAIIRNEDGEVLGWDTHYDDAPEPDDYFYDREDIDPADCDHGDRSMVGTKYGVNNEELQRETTIWLCDLCEARFPLTDEDWDDFNQ